MYFKETFNTIWSNSLWNKISIKELENIFENTHSNKKNFRKNLFQSFRSYIISKASTIMAHNPGNVEIDNYINIISFIAFFKKACMHRFSVK